MVKSDNYTDHMLSLTEKAMENPSRFGEIIEKVFENNMERKSDFEVSTSINGTITIDDIFYESSEV